MAKGDFKKKVDQRSASRKNMSTKKFNVSADWTHKAQKATKGRVTPANSVGRKKTVPSTKGKSEAKKAADSVKKGATGSSTRPSGSKVSTVRATRASGAKINVSADWTKKAADVVNKGTASRSSSRRASQRASNRAAADRAAANMKAKGGPKGPAKKAPPTSLKPRQSATKVFGKGGTGKAGQVIRKVANRAAGAAVGAAASPALAVAGAAATGLAIRGAIDPHKTSKEAGTNNSTGGRTGRAKRAKTATAQQVNNTNLGVDAAKVVKNATSFNVTTAGTGAKQAPKKAKGGSTRKPKGSFDRAAYRAKQAERKKQAFAQTKTGKSGGTAGTGTYYKKGGKAAAPGRSSRANTINRQLGKPLSGSGNAARQHNWSDRTALQKRLQANDKG